MEPLPSVSLTQQKYWVEAPLVPPYQVVVLSTAALIDCSVGFGSLIGLGTQFGCAVCFVGFGNRLLNVLLPPPRQQLRDFIDREWAAISSMQRFNWLRYELDQGAGPVRPNGTVRAMFLKDYTPELRRSFKTAARTTGLRHSVLGAPYLICQIVRHQLKTRGDMPGL